VNVTQLAFAAERRAAAPLLLLVGARRAVLFYAGTADAGTTALMLGRYHWLCSRQTSLEL